MTWLLDEANSLWRVILDITKLKRKLIERISVAVKDFSFFRFNLEGTAANLGYILVLNTRFYIMLRGKISKSILTVI